MLRIALDILGKCTVMDMEYKRLLNSLFFRHRLEALLLYV